MCWVVVNTAEGLVVANTTEAVVCVAVVGLSRGGDNTHDDDEDILYAGRGGLGFGLAAALPLVIDASCMHVGWSANAYGTTVV